MQPAMMQFVNPYQRGIQSFAHNPGGGPVGLPPNTHTPMPGNPGAAVNFPDGNGGASGGGYPSGYPGHGFTPQDIHQLIWWLKGGWVSDGMVCPPRDNPYLQQGSSGCPQGWIQCKQPIAANALAVGIGATVLITVTPRREATPRQFFYTGAAAAFTIDNIEIDGVSLSVGANAADMWSATANGTDNSVDWPMFSSTTPLLLTVTNISGAAADYRSTVVASVNRGGGGPM